MTTQTAKSFHAIKTIIGYLLKTLCLAFLVLGVAKILSNDGSWINYLIITFGLALILLAWRIGKASTIKFR